MTLEELEARVRTLEDIEEIKKLQARYTYLLDTDKWNEAVNLFTENAKVQLTGFLCEGKEEITKIYKELFGSGMMSMHRHMVIQPVIEVDGETARGMWYLFNVHTYKLPQGDTPMWSQAKYENEYVKEDGKWKISSLRYIINFRTPYADGWVKTPILDVIAAWKAGKE